MTVIAKLYIYLQRTDIQLIIPIFGRGNPGVCFTKNAQKTGLRKCPATTIDYTLNTKPIMERFYKFLLTATGLAGLLLSSCVKDAEVADASVKQTKTFRATTELATRTTLDGEHNVVWSEGDQIVVFGITDASNAIGHQFSLVEGAGTKEGVFSGSVESGYAGYYAIYPHSCYKNVYASGKYQINLNPSAVFTESNFVDGANPMIAYGTENDGFKFHNLCGIVEFRITGAGTITNIEVVSGDRKPLAGLFTADPETYELKPKNTFTDQNVENYQCIYASLAEPIELSQTPRSVYAILPPGTYENLQVRTEDSEGRIIVRTATKPVEVTRSHIVPVSEFSHGSETGWPSMQIFYVEERSNFYQSRIQFHVNSGDGFYYCDLTYADYESLAASGKSDYEILTQNAKKYAGTSAAMSLNTYISPDGKYVILGLAYTTIGEEDYVLSNNPTKLVFSAKQIPFDDTVSADLYGGNVSENDAIFAIKGNPSEASRALATIIPDNNYANYNDLEKKIAATTGMYAVHFSDSATNNGLVSFGNLIPNTKYHLLYTVTDGICWGMFTDIYTRYAPVQEYVFTTEAHTPSAATVTLAEEEVLDYTAKISATISEGHTKLKYICGDFDYEYSADEVAAYGIELSVAAGSTATIDLTNLTEETTYRFFAVAYDENDSYGVVSSLTFTTKAPIPVEDPEYAKFLGTYTMTVGTGSRPDARTVTISELVKGKKFAVKGLINPALVAQFQLDDTVTANFVNGEICIACQTIADSGTIPSQFGSEVTLLLRNEQYTWYNPDYPLRSAYNDGVLTLKGVSDDGMEWRGFNFQVPDAGYLEHWMDAVLTKQND